MSEETSEPTLVASYRIPEKKKRGGRRISFWLSILFFVSTIIGFGLAIWNYRNCTICQETKNQLEKENAELQEKNRELEDNAKRISTDSIQLQNDSTQLKTEIKKVQSDRDKLQEENEKLKNDYEKLLNSEVHVKITGLYNYKNFSTYLDSSEITYLYIDYKVFLASSFYEHENLFIKILEPDGTLMTGESSPDGYTMEVSPYLSHSGWGRKTPGAYHPGEYTIEFWYNGICVGKKTVQIF